MWQLIGAPWRRGGSHGATGTMVNRTLQMHHQIKFGRDTRVTVMTCDPLMFQLETYYKVKWLQYTSKVGKFITIDVKFSQDLTHQKSLKSVNFWQSY